MFKIIKNDVAELGRNLEVLEGKTAEAAESNNSALDDVYAALTELAELIVEEE